MCWLFSAPGVSSTTAVFLLFVALVADCYQLPMLMRWFSTFLSSQ